MILTIIQRQRGRQNRLIILTAIVSVLVAVSLLMNANLIVAVGYRWLEIPTITIILIYLIYAVYLLLSRNSATVGLMNMSGDNLEIIIHNETLHFVAGDLCRIKLVLNGYKGMPKGGKIRYSRDGMGNFLFFSVDGKTRFYEFFLSNAVEMNELVHFFKNHAVMKELSIVHTA